MNPCMGDTEACIDVIASIGNTTASHDKTSKSSQNPCTLLGGGEIGRRGMVDGGEEEGEGDDGDESRHEYDWSGRG